jgi:regulator of replication initiation timing
VQNEKVVIQENIQKLNELEEQYEQKISELKKKYEVTLKEKTLEKLEKEKLQKRVGMIQDKI